jgi:SAM-dependent methyltransferase
MSEPGSIAPFDASTLQWESAPCPCCGSESVEPIFEGPDRLHHLPGSFSFSRCLKCGAFRQQPRLAWSSLAAYYPEEYAAYHYSAPSTPSLRTKLANYGNVKRRRFVEKHLPGGRLLEVGCGTGAFLRELAASTCWQLEGIEPTPSAAAFTSQSLGLPIHQGRLDEIDLQPSSYDAVVMWCVLEHLTQPIEDLRRVHSLLKEGGWLFFSMPNSDSLEARIFGPYWSGWDLPRHLYVFPRRLLIETLSRLGFETRSCRCIGSSYQQLAHSLDFWSQSWAGRHPALRRLLLKAYNSWFGRLAFALPLALLDRLNLSTNITFAFKKRSLPISPS